jgi:protein O-mannosyl-transferase
MRPPGKSNRRDLRAVSLLALAIALITLGVYAQAGSFTFTNFDDPDYVARNEIVQQGFSAEGFRWAFTTLFIANWHPFTWLSHMLDCELFGLSAGAHHWSSIILHIINSVLLLWVLWRYTGCVEHSAVVAALFAVHPLHVESVAWIAERKDVLSMLFWLLTMLAYVRYVERHTALRYAVVLACFAGGLMSKPMVVTLPCVLLLMDYWPLQRATTLRDWPKLFLEKAPLFLLVVILSVVTFLAQRESNAVGSLSKFSLGARIGNALVAYTAYIGKTLLPEDLAAFYPHPGYWPVWQVVGALMFLGIVTAVATVLMRRRPYVTAGWFWYLGTLVPVIGLIQVGEQAFADRYTYIPLIGVFIALAWGVFGIATHLKWPAAATRGCAVAVIIVYALIAKAQVRHWENSETLFAHAVAVTKDNYVAHYNLGQTLSVSGRIHEAVEHYETTLRLKPDHAGAHNNLGFTRALEGRVEEATNYYAAALRIEPKNPDVHFNMAMAQLRLGNRVAAIEHFQNTLKGQPDHPMAHRYFADALMADGRASEAIAHYRAALQQNPNEPETLNNLAWLLATHPQNSIRDGKEALRLAQQACESTRNSVPSFLGTLAAAWAETGEFEKAIETAKYGETLAAQQGNTQLAARNAALRATYEQHRPHREMPSSQR